MFQNRDSLKILQSLAFRLVFTNIYICARKPTSLNFPVHYLTIGTQIQLCVHSTIGIPFINSRDVQHINPDNSDHMYMCCSGALQLITVNLN